MSIILASASPRRRELLQTAGIPFSICVSDVDETIPAGTAPFDAVMMLAERKASDVAKSHPEDTVIGADTVVALDNTILGKPVDAQDAKKMLRMLSGREHTVYTGVSIVRNGVADTFYVQTRVHFYPLTEAEIDRYIETGEPMDKAGAYGIQGRGCTLVEKIEGDYFNVVGLPISAVYRRLFGCI